MGVSEIRQNLELANQHTGYAHDALGRIADQGSVHQNTINVLGGKAEEIGSVAGRITGLLASVQEDVAEVRGNSLAISALIDTLPANEVEDMKLANDRIGSDIGIVSRTHVDPAVEKVQEAAAAEAAISGLSDTFVVSHVGKGALRLLQSAMDLTQRVIGKL